MKQLIIAWANQPVRREDACCRLNCQVSSMLSLQCLCCRRNAGDKEDDTHERIGEIHSAVQKKQQDERSISER